MMKIMQLYWIIIDTIRFKYLGTTVTNQNLIQTEIKRTQNFDNALLLLSPEPSVFSSAVERTYTLEYTTL
jgi:hypothetical protein